MAIQIVTTLTAAFALAALGDIECVEDIQSPANLPLKMPIFGLPSTEFQANTPTHNA